MSKNLVERYAIALRAYEDALAVAAKRGGANYEPGGSINTPLLTAAGRLAMPSIGSHAEDSVPALESLMGHLHDQNLNGYYSPQMLTSGRSAIIPVEARPADLTERYAAQWQALHSELDSLAANTALPVREANMLGLLQRYGSSMAAPASGDTDVSLYDYTRVQAALAVCLADSPPGGDSVAVLIGGDLSGVQEWLYTIGSEGAAKSLRGRSVYLQLLSEVVAQWLLDRLDLPSCHLLYAGGGNFYLLAPSAAETAIDDIQVEVTRRLLAMHGGALYLALGASKVTAADLAGEHIGEVWGAVSREMSKRKRHRFTELSDAEMAQVIGSPLAGTGRLEDSCHVCRRPIAASEQETHPADGDERVCQLCRSFEALGSRLPWTAFLVMSRLREPAAAAAVLEWDAGLRQFGYDVQFLRRAQARSTEWQRQASELVRIYFWQDDRPALHEFPGNPDPQSTVWLFRPLAQAAPIVRNVQGDERVATLDQLQTVGIKRWGVLRMDVDKLGPIFQSGIPATNLSRVVGLSGMLRLFFEGHVPRLVAELNRNAPNVYLMYAGGDDLFVVGGWSHLPELAWQVREALRKLAVSNDKITISGGISLAKSKSYPIYQAAEDAGEAEEMAKREGRNRIAFLGQAVEWENKKRPDFSIVRNRVFEITEWLENSKLNRSFLTSLRTIDAEQQRWKAKKNLTENRYQHADGRLYLGPWQWHLVYSISRAAERVNEVNLSTSIKHYMGELIASEIDVLGIETRWAELLTRTGDEQHD